MIMVVVVTVLLLLMIIISLTRIGRRQRDHIYDRHDSADPRGPA
jgi:branched-subunit amino acid ABC-type transport system permease component